MAARDRFLAHLNPDQALDVHLLEVSRLAEEKAGKIVAAQMGAALGILHDLGKYSTEFQTYLSKIGSGEDTESDRPKRGDVDHSTAGAQAVWKRFGTADRIERVVGEILSLCIASHHSGLIDCVRPDGTNGLLKRVNKDDSRSNYSEAWENAASSVRERVEAALHGQPLIASLSTVVGRICELDRGDKIRRFKVGLFARFLFSCLIDADRTNTADSADPRAAALRRRSSADWPTLVERLERYLEGLGCAPGVNALRRGVSDACRDASARPKGIYTLTVPTGGGKTLASLRFALGHAKQHGMDRVIYVSPYTSIVDQNADVVRKILEPKGVRPGDVVLEHHSNLTPLHQTWRSKILSENWDAPVVFTTAVQFLEAWFGSGTRAVRRLHQLARAVVVFDEVQTLPVRCVHMFNNALSFLTEHCGATVVLCTATQPLLDRVNPEKGCLTLPKDSELVQDVPELFAGFRRNEALDRRKAGGWSQREVAQLAVEEVNRAGSCLVVVNTKAEAKSIFVQCQGLASGSARVWHLSTNMCAAHRLADLTLMKQRLGQEPVICVSTQLIEAGVDISFGSAIRALAGIDSVTQTAGRCNRNGELLPALGRVHVVNLQGEVPASLVDIRLAQEAGRRVLDECCREPARSLDLSDPAVIERFFLYYFFDRQKEMDYPVGPKQAERDDTLLNMLSANQSAAELKDEGRATYMRQAFLTAAEAFRVIDSDHQGVLVPYEEGKEIITALSGLHPDAHPFELLKKAQRYSVNLFPRNLEALQRVGAIREVRKGTGILYLDEKYYTLAFGLEMEGSGELEFQNA